MQLILKANQSIFTIPAASQGNSEADGHSALCAVQQHSLPGREDYKIRRAIHSALLLRVIPSLVYLYWKIGKFIHIFNRYIPLGTAWTIKNSMNHFGIFWIPVKKLRESESRGKLYSFSPVFGKRIQQQLSFLAPTWLWISTAKCPKLFFPFDFWIDFDTSHFSVCWLITAACPKWCAILRTAMCAALSTKSTRF